MIAKEDHGGTAVGKVGKSARRRKYEVINLKP